MTAAGSPANAAASVHAELIHLCPTLRKPVQYALAGADDSWPDAPRFHKQRVSVHDGRAIAADLSLDREGFALSRLKSKVRDFTDDEEVRARYYPEVEQLIKAATGAAKVVIFDHTRRRDTGAPDRESGQRVPVRRVHNDYTARSGPQRLDDLLPPGAAARWKHGRYAVINVWRSIEGTVEAAPLAVADASSMSPGDFVATDLVYPDRRGEIYYVTANPGHRWYYFPKMREEEAILLKCFDSREEGVARFTAHTAFDDNTALPNPLPRHSIEVRALVLLEDPKERFSFLI